MIKDLLKYHRMPLLLLLSCCALYLSFAYDLERSDFPKLLSLYLAIGFLSWKFFQMEKVNTPFLIAACLLFRFIFLFSTPGLSQDFYRFLWDGQLVLQGVNPYLFTPEEIMATADISFPQASELFSGMGSLSAGNHSNYPPLSQLLFAFAALFTGKTMFGGILALRIILLLAEVGIYYFGRKLLKLYGLPENRIFWFLLNPLIIIELTGNLHFEGVMIFFLLWGLYLLHQQKFAWAGLVFSLSVLVKLIPLLFLPLLLPFFRKNLGGLRLKKLLVFYSTVGLGCMAGFLPFLTSGSVSNYLATVGLWFQKFEFNASIYYLVRWVGFQVKGYNIIGTAGMLLGVVVLVAVIIIAWYFWKHVKAVKMVRTEGTNAAVRADTWVRPYGGLLGIFWGISIYYFLATTVHPWYLALPLILCIFTRSRFPVVWALASFLSYSAYSGFPADENLWLVALEYLMVFGYLGYEIIQQIKRKSSFRA